MVSYTFLNVYLLHLSDMIENSRKWALARGLVETNAVHGMEEWRIPVERSFEHTVSKSHETNQRVNFVTEDIIGLIAFAPLIDILCMGTCTFEYSP